jgi:hypothetical protein
MEDNKKKAKMCVLKKLVDMLKGMDSEGFEESLRKVTVAAKDDKGLIKGLDKAKEIIKKKTE